MAKIRHEINLIDAVKSYSVDAAGTVVIQSEPIARFDPTQYSGTLTGYFEIVAKKDSGTNVRIRLRDATASITLAAITFTNTSYERSRTSIASLPTSACDLNISTSTISGVAGTASVKAMRMIIIQDTGSDPLTSTETQIEVGAEQTGNVNTTLQPLTNPKYWYYDSAVWDGTCTFYAECTNFQTGSGVITIKLQEDNGSFGGWADKVTIVNAATPSSVTRTRSAAFTPTSGRNYRIVGMVANSMDTWAIYNAKIIVQQTGEIDNALTDSGGGIAIQGGVASSSETNQCLGTSFVASDSYDTTRVDLSLTRDASPTDNLYIELLSGSITGTVLGTSADVTGSTISTSGQWVTFTFASPISLTNGTEYYIRLFRDGSRDTTNQYFWRSNNTDVITGECYVRSNNSWSSPSNIDRSFKVFSDASGITKLEPQYLLANAAVGAGTGLQDFDTYYDPAEWDGVTNVYYHEGQNVSGGTSDIKLQSDPNGTPADVTSSTVTDVVERERSSAMTMPGTAQTIDVNQTGT